MYIQTPGWPVESAVPTADSGNITFTGISEALGGDPTADFRLTIKAGSIAPTTGDFFLATGLDEYYGVTDNGAPMLSDATVEYLAHTIAGMELFLGCQNGSVPSGGAVKLFVEVKVGGVYVALSTLPGIGMLDGYGAYESDLDVTPFWTDLVGCIQG